MLIWKIIVTFLLFPVSLLKEKGVDMNVSSVHVQKHITIDGEEHITHVFTFSDQVDINKIKKHPAIDRLIENKALSCYLLLPSSCPKTIRLKIFRPKKS